MSILFNFKNYLNKIVEIQITNNYEYIGKIIGFDVCNNLILEDCEEIFYNNNLRKKRNLGNLILRTNCIWSINLKDN